MVSKNEQNSTNPWIVRVLSLSQKSGFELCKARLFKGWIFEGPIV
jgi:hypothetical protein